MAVTVRAFRDRDWPQVLAIVREVAEAGETYATDPSWTESDLRAFWVATPAPAGTPPTMTVVAVDGDQVLGTARSSANRPGRGAHVATASFMVTAEARGRGVGRILGTHVLDWATRSGYRAMQFNAVVTTNEAAVRLWQDLGFTVVGTVPEAFDHPAHGLVGLHVMHRRLP